MICTELYKTNIIISIIFIHGLNGHPEYTWTYRAPRPTTNTFASLRSVFGKGPKSKRGETQAGPTSVFWPLDLLPQNSTRARIITYGHDARVLAVPNNTTIYTLSKDFLMALASLRRPGNRPIIFVAHSVGGLILKKVRTPSLVKVCTNEFSRH